MSRNTTPSIFASLTAYDSSGDEEVEEEETSEEKQQTGLGQGQVTVLFHQPPPSESSSSVTSLQNPPSLAQNYDDEENFEYHRPPEELEDDDDNLVEAEENESSKPALTEGEVGGLEKNGNSGVQGEDGNKTEGDGTCNSNSLTKRRKVQLPPEPEGACPAELQLKFTKMYELKMRSKCSLSERMQKRKDLRNPSIYEKLIILCDIDEHGTNFPDSPKWDPSSYYDQLDKVQRDEMERRMKDKKAKEAVKVDFVTGTLKKPEPPKPPSAYIRAFGSLAFKN